MKEIYSSCPYCGINATDRRIVKRHKKKTRRFSTPPTTEEGLGVDDIFDEEVDCVQFHPCGHEFPRKEIKRLDRTTRLLHDLRKKIMNAEPEKVSRLIEQSRRARNRLNRLEWELKDEKLEFNESLGEHVMKTETPENLRSNTQSVGLKDLSQAETFGKPPAKSDGHDDVEVSLHDTVGPDTMEVNDEINSVRLAVDWNEDERGVGDFVESLKEKW